jgi:hypothetical protein
MPEFRDQRSSPDRTAAAREVLDLNGDEVALLAGAPLPVQPGAAARGLDAHLALVGFEVPGEQGPAGGARHARAPAQPRGEVEHVARSELGGGAGGQDLPVGVLHAGAADGGEGHGHGHALAQHGGLKCAGGAT